MGEEHTRPKQIIVNIDDLNWERCWCRAVGLNSSLVIKSEALYQSYGGAILWELSQVKELIV